MQSDYRFNQRWLIGLLRLAAAGCTTMAADSGQPRDLDIVARWRGDHPVDRMDLLSGDQGSCRTGYRGDRHNSH
jgi:hypothetical protein